MATKKQEDLPIARVGDVPAHLINFVGENAPDTLETMRHHRVLNRIAVIKSNSPSEKKEKFGEASVCIPATETIIARKGESFEAVPVMFFDEFIQWGDRNDKAGPMLRSRSMDRASLLAQKCGDPMRREEKYGDKPFTAKNCHHLNFMVVITSGENKGTLAVISFSRSEFKKGMALIGAIQARRIKGYQAPMWATVWEFSTSLRKNEKGEWWGIDFRAAENPWVEDPKEAEQLKKIHETLKDEYKNQLLEVGHEAAETLDGDEAATGASATDM